MSSIRSANGGVPKDAKNGVATIAYALPSVFDNLSFTNVALVLTSVL